MTSLDDFRQQNPAYKDVADDKLADGLYNKFYAGKIDRDEFNSKIGISQDPGFISRVGGDLKDRFGKAVDAVGAGQEGKQSSLETGAQIAGNTMAGGVNDIIGEGVKSLTPDFVKDAAGSAVKSVFDTDIGKQALAAAQKGEQYYKDWAAKNPRAARDVEAGLNLSTVAPVGKVASAAVDAAPSVAKSIVSKFGDVADSRSSLANKKELFDKPRNTPLTSRAVKDSAQQKYGASEGMVAGEQKDPFLGSTPVQVPAARISPTYVQKIFDKIKLTPKSPYQEVTYANDAVNQILSKYKDAINHPMGVEDFEGIDKTFTQEIWNETDNRGILSSKGKRLLDSQNKIRDAVYKDVTEKDIVGDKKAFDAYKSAVKTWHDSKLMENLEFLKDKAEVSDNPGLVYRRGFERIYNNKGLYNSYPKEVQEMIKKGAVTSMGQEYLRALGSRISSYIAATVHPAAAMAAPAVARGARSVLGDLSEKRTTKMLNILSDPYRDDAGSALSEETHIEGLSK